MSKANKWMKDLIDSGRLDADLEGNVYFDGTLLKTTRSSTGYLQIGVYDAETQNSVTMMAHRIVLYALTRDETIFRDDMHVHHINGDKQDNRIENLELIAARTHMARHNIGNSNRKYISDDTRKQVKDMQATHSQREIARLVGISATQVRRILGLEK